MRKDTTTVIRNQAVNRKWPVLMSNRAKQKLKTLEFSHTSGGRWWWSWGGGGNSPTHHRRNQVSPLNSFKRVKIRSDRVSVFPSTIMVIHLTFNSNLYSQRSTLHLVSINYKNIKGMYPGILLWPQITADTFQNEKVPGVFYGALETLYREKNTII